MKKIFSYFLKVTLALFLTLPGCLCAQNLGNPSHSNGISANGLFKLIKTEIKKSDKRRAEKEKSSPQACRLRAKKILEELEKCKQSKRSNAPKCNVDKINDLLQKGVDMALDGGKILQETIYAGELELAQQVLHYGEDSSFFTIPHDHEPLMVTVAKQGMYPLIEPLANININFLYETTNLKETPLHFAASTDTVKTLLQFGANIDAQNIYGQTPLWYAAKAPNYPVMQYLCQRGANPLIQNKQGQTLLQYLVDLNKNTSNQINAGKTLEFLLNITQLNEATLTALLQDLVDSKDMVKTVEFLLNMMEKRQQLDKDMLTALLSAELKKRELFGHDYKAEKGRKILHLLLKYGANPNIFIEKEKTPLYIAIDIRNIEVAALLLQFQADPLLGNPCALELAFNFSYHDPTGLEKNLLQATDSSQHEQKDKILARILSNLISQAAGESLCEEKNEAKLQAYVQSIHLLLEHNADPFFKQRDSEEFVGYKKRTTALGQAASTANTGKVPHPLRLLLEHKRVRNGLDTDKGKLAKDEICWQSQFFPEVVNILQEYEMTDLCAE